MKKNATRQRNSCRSSNARGYVHCFLVGCVNYYLLGRSGIFARSAPNTPSSSFLTFPRETRALFLVAIIVANSSWFRPADSFPAGCRLSIYLSQFAARDVVVFFVGQFNVVDRLKQIRGWLAETAVLANPRWIILRQTVLA